MATDYRFPLRKTIDGELFKLSNSSSTYGTSKKQAEKTAKMSRMTGWKARVIKKDRKYAVYVRKKGVWPK